MKYAAFISYSHAEDARLGVALQRALERFAVPWYRPRGRRVFRDATELAASPSLWGTIRAALEQSEYLVLLLSPSAARSPWVDREVGYWLSIRSPDRLILVITRWGDGTEGAVRNLGAFAWTGPDVPPALRGTLTEEPRPVDLRWARAQPDLSLRDSRFRDTVAEVAAPVLGRSKAELVGEHLRQRRLFRWAAAGFTALVVALSAFAGVSSWRAAVRGRLAASRQLAAQAQDAMVTQHDLALLLSVVAFGVQPTAEARGALLATLLRRPEVERHLSASSTDLTAVDMTRDGRVVAAGSRDGRLIAWEASRGWASRTLCAWDDVVSALAFAPQGDRLAVVAGSRRRVTVLDVRSGDVLWESTDLVRDTVSTVLAFDADGRFLALGGLEGRLTIVHTATGEVLPVKLGGHPEGVLAVAFQPGGSLLASGGWDQTIRLWDRTSGREVRRLLPTGQAAPAPPPSPNPWLVPDHRKPVLGLAFSQDGKLLESFTQGGLLNLWEVASGRRLSQAQGPERPAYLGMAADGRTLAFERGRDLLIWDARTNRTQTLDWLHPSIIMGVGFGGRPGQMVTVGGDQAIVLDFERPRPVGSPVLGPLDPAPKSGVHLSPDASVFAYSDRNGALWVWRTDRGSPMLGPLKGHEEIATDIAFSLDGTTMASVADDGVMIVWDLSSGTPRFRRDVHPYGTDAVAFSPDGHFLAAAGAVNPGETFNPRTGELFKPSEPQWQLSLWDVATGTGRGAPWSLPDNGTIWDLQFSPDGGILAIGASNATTLWDPRSGHSIGEPLAGEGMALAFSSDGRLALVGAGSVRLWDRRAGGRLAALGAPFSGTLETVALSPDGRTVAFAGDDSSLLLWDVEENTQLGPDLSLPDRAWDTLVFRADGRQLVTAGAGGVVEWDLDPESWVRKACAVANRALTPGERDQYLGKASASRACGASTLRGPRNGL